jgi:hypothetical protein
MRRCSKNLEIDEVGLVGLFDAPVKAAPGQTAALVFFASVKAAPG